MSFLEDAMPTIEEFAPEVIGLFFGKPAEVVAEKVVEIVQELTGEDDHAEGVKQVKKDPEKCNQLREAILKHVE